MPTSTNEGDTSSEAEALSIAGGKLLELDGGALIMLSSRVTREQRKICAIITAVAVAVLAVITALTLFFLFSFELANPEPLTADELRAVFRNGRIGCNPLASRCSSKHPNSGYCTRYLEDFLCRCEPGYVLRAEICDIDEETPPCKYRCDPYTESCKPKHMRDNYNCSCMPGYESVDDGPESKGLLEHVCADRDETADFEQRCRVPGNVQGSKIINTGGFFDCNCTEKMKKFFDSKQQAFYCVDELTTCKSSCTNGVCYYRDGTSTEPVCHCLPNYERNPSGQCELSEACKKCTKSQFCQQGNCICKSGYSPWWRASASKIECVPPDNMGICQMRMTDMMATLRMNSLTSDAHGMLSHFYSIGTKDKNYYADNTRSYFYGMLRYGLYYSFQERFKMIREQDNRKSLDLQFLFGILIGSCLSKHKDDICPSVKLLMDSAFNSHTASVALTSAKDMYKRLLNNEHIKLERNNYEALAILSMVILHARFSGTCFPLTNNCRYKDGSNSSRYTMPLVTVGVVTSATNYLLRRCRKPLYLLFAGSIMNSSLKELADSLLKMNVLSYPQSLRKTHFPKGEGGDFTFGPFIVGMLMFQSDRIFQYLEAQQDKNPELSPVAHNLLEKLHFTTSVKDFQQLESQLCRHDFIGKGDRAYRIADTIEAEFIRDKTWLYPSSKSDQDNNANHAKDIFLAPAQVAAIGMPTGPGQVPVYYAATMVTPLIMRDAFDESGDSKTKLCPEGTGYTYECELKVFLITAQRLSNMTVTQYDLELFAPTLRYIPRTYLHFAMYWITRLYAARHKTVPFDESDASKRDYEVRIEGFNEFFSKCVMAYTLREPVTGKIIRSQAVLDANIVGLDPNFIKTLHHDDKDTY